MENKKSGPWRSKIEEEMWKEATEQMNGYVPWKKMDVSPIIIHEHPGVGGEPFTIRLSSQWFNPGDIISPSLKPKWWQKLLTFVTFGLYKPKAPTLYVAGYDPYTAGSDWDLDSSAVIVYKMVDGVASVVNGRTEEDFKKDVEKLINGENKEGKV